ncbi:MAG: hypothetical protein AB7G93_19230 [Bdellovibrionales bacterium]
MKYIILTAILITAGVLIYYAGFHKSSWEAHQEWKRRTVEAETRVRPPHFADMKMIPGPEPVPVRQPSSERTEDQDREQDQDPQPEP